MAVNKRKVLDAARKFAQKGAKEKALKEYNTLLKLDPKDAKLHLEIGDAYRRWGQLDDAIAQYARVAEQYQQEGFDARAVAVLKQILNLDPKRYETYVSLSELYQHMGLDSEAIGALQAAADGYHKEGQRREALGLLRRMASLDPTNTTSRMKVADLLRQEGLNDEAVTEYDGVAEELLRTGTIDVLAPVYERILEIQPNRVDVLVGLARNLIELKSPERAEPFAAKALEKGADVPEHYELLSDVYKALGRVDDLVGVMRSLAKLYRERGDEQSAREVIQRLPAGAGLEFEAAPDDEVSLEDPVDDRGGPPDFGLSADVDDDLDVAVEDGADDELLDDDLLEDELLDDDDEFFDAGGDSGVVEFDLDDADDDSTPVNDAAEEAPPTPEGDPDQLLAEASVYLRYGKVEQAVSSLRAIVAGHPGHRAALEKLGEAHSEAGDSAAAIEVWVRAAQRAREEDDLDAVAVLRDRVASLDPAAAAEIPLPEADATGDDVGGFDLDDDFDADDELLAADAPPTSHEVDLEMELDLDGDDLDVSADERTGAGAAMADTDESTFGAEASLESSAEEEIEIELEGDLDMDLDVAAEASAVAFSEDVEETSGSAPVASVDVDEDLEEGEFYFQQGLYEEAEAIYRRVLASAPNHPSALLRLGEIEEARGGDASASTEPAVEAPEGESSAFSLDTDGSALADVDEAELGGSDEQAIEFDSDDVELETSDPAAQTEEAFEVELGAGDLDEELSFADSERELPAVDEDDDPTETEISVDTAADQGVAESSARDDQTMPMEADEDAFDLAAELRDELEEEDAREAAAESTGSGSTEEVAFESIFNDFKKGVSETLSDADFETRYDLAIAYREMELYDDAIAEFSRCLESDSRRLDSLCMMALCAIDLGRGQDAVAHLEQALGLPDVAAERRIGIQFDLGRAFVSMQDVARAREAFESVAAAAPDFPGIAEALAELDALSASDGSVELASDEGESFADLIAEVEAEDEEPFENFDDLVTDPELSAPVIEGTPLDDDGSEDPKPARKKKISFV